MPNDEPPSTRKAAENDAAQPKRAATPLKRPSIFAIPEPVKRVFNNFPLTTYEPNELPARAPKQRDEPTLHVFATPEDASRGRPSFNPGCLKWQAYLKFSGLSFRTVASSNHASPSGALPFLLPAVSTTDTPAALQPVPSNKLKKWMASQAISKKVNESSDLRYEAYASLLDNRIRKAWLYQLYLIPENFNQVARHLYVQPCSSQPFVQLAIGHQLYKAAEIELSKTVTVVDGSVLLKDAEEALVSLSTLLGEEQWFFAQETPGLFDASVFAYAHLLLDENMGWRCNDMGDALHRHANLARHRDRILSGYF